MEEQSRKTGIDIIDDVSWGTHLCLFYHTQEDLLDILIPYFRAGLENNEFCMWVTSEPLLAEDAKKALERVVPRLDAHIAEGQIEFLDYRQWYTKRGVFEADKVLEGWVGKEDQALQSGFDGLRVTGNTFWLEKQAWSAFRDYEARVDGMLDQHRMIAICTYCLERCGVWEVIDIVSNHPSAFVHRDGKWEIIQSAERKRAEQLRELSSHMQSSIEEERIRISRELHDELGQLLTGLKLELYSVDRAIPPDQGRVHQRIEWIAEGIARITGRMQQISKELRPSMLDQLGVGAAIRWQVRAFQARTQIRCRATIDPEELELDRDRSTVVFRVLQEILTNVFRHAHATGVDVSLRAGGKEVVLEVRDDGRGIRAEEVCACTSLGLVGMRERVRPFGGGVKIVGVEGKGTTVTVRIPLEGHDADGR